MLIPVGLILAYGALRVSASLFNELREALFARVTQNAVRKVALRSILVMSSLNHVAMMKI
jgi:ATP-binding cassette, subfamily B, heavy metal transporter